MHCKMLKIEWFGLVRGHPRSLKIAPFDRAHTTSYSSLIETPKVPFPILFRTTLTTVLHYRANCDYTSILYHLRDIAFDRSKIAIFIPLLRITLPAGGGFPWDDLRKILHGGQKIASVQSGEEILPKASTD